jgi:steroid 5-alpha reductase family enzyme
MKVYFILLTAVILYSSFWFGISVLLKRNDVADIAWGLGFVMLSWLSFVLSDTDTFRSWLVNALVSIWGISLAWHIGQRNQGKAEDFRYHQWRMEWKHFYTRSFLQVFMLQGILMYIIALPVFYIHQAPVTDFTLVDAMACLLWGIGFYWESMADYQLKKFKENPQHKGVIITTGLWKYSRHPNYFGEVVQWWGVFLLTIQLNGGWIMMISPLMITYLIRYVSGVPMLERKYLGRPDFIQYAEKTSIFFPRKPLK